MSILNVVTYTLPAYWASYLINGDPSGLEEGEQAQIDRWLRVERPGYPVDCGEAYFAHSNDATSDRCLDVADFTFHAFPEEVAA